MRLWSLLVRQLEKALADSGHKMVNYAANYYNYHVYFKASDFFLELFQCK